MTEQTNPEIIQKIDGFMKWVHSTGTPSIYRGVPNDGEYEVSSSIFLRMFPSRQPSSHADTHFQQEVIELVEKARRLGHGFKDGKKLSDLELLAELQHYGAATCLVDFTHNALIALWFACQPTKDGNKTKLGGKVVRFDSESEKCIKIGSKHLDEEIDYFLGFGTSPISKGNNYLRQTQDMVFVWRPLHQNERITAQQSVFLFGPPKIPIDENNDFIILEEYKKDIIEELRKIGVFEDALFCDFHGFAKINAHDRKYPDLSPEYHCNKGQENYNIENYETAIQYYTSALLSDKKCGKAYYGIAQAKYKMGDFASAILDYRDAIDNGHKDADVYYYLGISERNYGNISHAIDCFSETIKLNQKFEEAYLARGDSYRILGKYDSAIKDYDEAIEINQDAFSAFFNRGSAKAESGDIQGAINDFDTVIRISPQHVDAFFNRGGAKASLDNHQEAIKDFDDVIRISPQHVDAFNNRGIARVNQNNFQEAFNDFDQIIRINPQHVDAFNNRGLVKANQGNIREAINDYNEAIQINPQYALPFYNRANAKRLLNDLQGALNDYDESIRLNSQFAAAFHNRAICKSHLGDKHGAWADIQEAQRLDPELKIPEEVQPPDKGNKK